MRVVGKKWREWEGHFGGAVKWLIVPKNEPRDKGTH
jgi:hypothetical protein